jgi:hypothetical protein
MWATNATKLSATNAMQQMWIGGATNAERAATNARDATNVDRGRVQQM